ncbi:MAG: hypothetical protein HKN21_02685, partial [Candidatus Eisenbacteria bacterium]|nr:hypothetical protein [Candidatus Eisenbacteria bacterium]
SWFFAPDLLLENSFLEIHARGFARNDLRERWRLDGVLNASVGTAGGGNIRWDATALASSQWTQRLFYRKRFEFGGKATPLNQRAWATGVYGRGWNGEKWQAYSKAGLGTRVSALGMEIDLGIHGLLFTKRTQTMFGEDFLPPDNPESTDDLVFNLVNHHSYFNSTVGFLVKRGAWDFSLGTGVRFGASHGNNQVWGDVGATYRVSDQVSVLMGIGHQPSEPEINLPDRTFVHFGAEFQIVDSGLDSGGLSEWEPFAVIDDPQGFQRLRIFSDEATQVEIMGDFTDWTPLPMKSVAYGLWEVQLVIQPGAHRVCFRVDGDAWKAPPGLTSVEDEFNGTVGLFYVD